MTALTDTVSGDLTYFSPKFIESGFITLTAADDVLTQHGVGNIGKARQLLNCVRLNYTTVADKQEWVDKFTAIFSSEAAYADLADQLRPHGAS